VISDLVGDGTENRRGLAERARAWMTTTV